MKMFEETAKEWLGVGADAQEKAAAPDQRPYD